ncbi:hypothetical protein LVY72_01320 [Arthrobacter sp. I2-34]|uniref:Uncharacterized protein n=1 Tax=Arthrobacter hankyongi TaxID=2904801 RepID=A0ABS9L1G8_9MICC|nr:hypothetical protein [Arthrobacter hankyongi]MCG2620547.1 hypothetical protein [Arthrobacter hankyongi]
MNIPDVPRRRRWTRFSLALAAAAIIAAGTPGVASAQQLPGPTVSAPSVVDQTTSTESGVTPAVPLPTPNVPTVPQPAGPGTVPAEGPVPEPTVPADPPAGHGSDPVPSSESPKPGTSPTLPQQTDAETAPSDNGQTGRPQPAAPGPAGPGTDRPDAGQDGDNASDPADGRPDPADNSQPAQLRMVQKFNVPKADFGRYWTLSARQDGRTVLGGPGPKAPAQGYGSVPAGKATVLSARVDPDWSRARDLAGATVWTCRDEDSGVVLSLRGGHTLEPMAAGQQVVCTASEELRDGPLSVVKSSPVLKQDAAGRWTLSYDIRVSNTSRAVDAHYGLTETLDFGPGIGIVSAGWTRLGEQPQPAGRWPDPQGTRSLVLAAAGTDIGHSAGAYTVHTYRITAVVTVQASTPEAALTCRDDGDPSGGLASTALLNGRIQATECRTVPVRLWVDKVWDINGTEYRHGSRPAGFDAALRLSALGIVEPAGGTAPERLQPPWDAEAGSYRPGTSLTVAEKVDLPPGCAVTGTGGTGTRRLTTAITRVTVRTSIECVQRLTLINRLAPAEMVQRVSGKWLLTATAEGTGRPALSGTSGTSREVKAGTHYRLGDVPAFAGAAEFTGQPWSCQLDSGSGELIEQDGGVVPGYGQHITCTVTETWKGPQLEVSKNAGAPVPVPGTAGSQWEVVYGISVKNASMVAPGRYSLVDWLAFGKGVEIVSARWMLPVSNLSGSWTEPGSFPLAWLASGRAIDVMDSHDYLVAVRVRVAAGTDPRELDCLPDAGGETGLMNMVALNQDTVVEACAALDHVVGNGHRADGGILAPPAEGPAAGSGRAPAEPPSEQADGGMELIRLSPVLTVSSIDKVGAATATGMLMLVAVLVLFLSRLRRR